MSSVGRNSASARPAPRIVMITGSSAGAGKSTLARSLADTLRENGAEADLVAEEAIFKREEFTEVASGFRTRDWPRADQFLRAYALLFDSWRRTGSWAVFDWSCLDMIEDLPWAQGMQPLVRMARSVRVLASGLSPLLIGLDVDLTVAAKRVLTRDSEWIQAWMGTGLDLPLAKPSVSEVIRRMETGGARNAVLFDAFRLTGWPVSRLDANQNADAVLMAARRVLGL